MNQLEKKYLHDKLTPNELTELRKQVSSLSDQEIENRLMQKWTESNSEDYEQHTARTEMIGKRLEAKLFPPSILTYDWVRIARIAGLWFIPILLFSTVYFYQQSARIGEGDVLVQVGRGERASIVLPDGTTVSLNSESELKYNPNHFNKKTRNVHFQGEAYFEVTSNPNAPFVVATSGMKLKVLGTKFNILSRKQDTNIEVALLEGHVLLTSEQSDNQELFNNEKAILNKTTGKFTVSKKEIERAVAWRQDEMVFYNQTLEEILHKLELNYNITFDTDQISALLTDRFTGTLPSNNLIEVLEILKHSYNLSCIGNSQHITLSKP